MLTKKNKKWLVLTFQSLKHEYLFLTKQIGLYLCIRLSNKNRGREIDRERERERESL